MRQRTERYEEGHTPTYVAACLSMSTFALRGDLMGIWIYWACILLFITAFITEGSAEAINRNRIKTSSTAYSCYVCLPHDKSSAEATEMFDLFSYETQQQILDCAKFALNFSNDFVHPCPLKYLGCQLQIHGENESLLCAQFSLNDCKSENKIELCRCIICDAKRLQLSPSTTESERESKRVWQSSETDDEDLLSRRYHHLDKMQDDDADVGSGDWEPPPGVILLETSTPKPTLIPNLRPDSRTTTPIPTNGVESFSIHLDMWVVVSVISVAVLV